MFTIHHYHSVAGIIKLPQTAACQENTLWVCANIQVYIKIQTKDTHSQIYKHNLERVDKVCEARMNTKNRQKAISRLTPTPEGHVKNAAFCKHFTQREKENLPMWISNKRNVTHIFILCKQLLFQRRLHSENNTTEQNRPDHNLTANLEGRLFWQAKTGRNLLMLTTEIHRQAHTQKTNRLLKPNSEG